MRHAIFTVSARGIGVADRLCDELHADVFVKEGREASGEFFRYKLLGEIVAKSFSRYDSLIFISSAGIAVRMIAPHLRSKLTDPAVVVVDESARHAISLLSGHVGGANELTRLIAKILGADPVITTATDASGHIAPDAISAKLGLRPYPKSAIQDINGALLDGAKIIYYIDEKTPRANFYREKLREFGIFPESLGSESQTVKNSVVITDHPGDYSGLLLIPRRLIAGIGCRRGVSSDEILMALSDACDRIGQDIGAISAISSAWVKADEQGLLAAAEKIGVKATFYELEELARTILRYGLSESDFVKNQIGVGNVSEAAALTGLKNGGRLALPKTKYSKVTVALVWEK